MEKDIVLMSNRFRNKNLQQLNLLHVATLGRSVGLKGDMKLNLHTDFPEQFQTDTSFILEDGKEIIIESYNSDRDLVKIKGIDSPEAAKVLTNSKLFTTQEETRVHCNLKEGEFFWFDLIGAQVFENEFELGTVEQIERIGTLDYLLVKTSSFFVDKGLTESFLIPYIDQFVISFDCENKVVTVKGGIDLLEAS